MIFQNFFRGKFHFSPTFLGEIFPRNFPRKKVYEKSAPGTLLFFDSKFLSERQVIVVAFYKSSRYYTCKQQDTGILCHSWLICDRVCKCEWRKVFWDINKTRIIPDIFEFQSGWFSIRSGFLRV
jgi:hypothetical protein